MNLLTEEDISCMVERAEYVSHELAGLRNASSLKIMTENDDMYDLSMDADKNFCFYVDKDAVMLQNRFTSIDEHAASMVMMVDKDARLDAITLVALNELKNTTLDEIDTLWLEENMEHYNLTFREPLKGEKAVLVVDLIFNRCIFRMDEFELYDAIIGLQILLFAVDKMLSKSAEENLIAFQQLQGEPDGSA